jgi:hypothetical protein
MQRNLFSAGFNRACLTVPLGVHRLAKAVRKSRLKPAGKSFLWCRKPPAKAGGKQARRASCNLLWNKSARIVRTICVSFCLLAVLCLACDALADDLPFAAQLLVPAKGDRASATLISISADGEFQFRIAEADRRVQSDELISWGAPAEPRTDRQLVLADGGIIPVRLNPLPTTADEQLIAVSDTFGELKLPLKLLAGVMFHAPIDPQRRDELAARLRAAGEEGGTASSKNADRLLLENGDELRGRIVALTETAVQVEAELGALTVEIERVAALAFNPSLRFVDRSNGTRLLVGFRAGTVLSARSVRLTEGRTEVVLADGASPLATDEQPVYLQPIGGAIQYLSDLSPAGYRHLPYLGLPFEYQLDINVAGTRLRAGGKIYPKGIGMHSAARLTWQLEKIYRRFQAELAIDDQTGGRGSVVFRVFSGAKEIYKSPVVRGGEAPLPISVDVRDARQLSLVIDFADRADILDHADWLNARLSP